MMKLEKDEYLNTSYSIESDIIKKEHTDEEVKISQLDFIDNYSDWLSDIKIKDFQPVMNIT